MAGTTVAYSEITILDLIDTATYIYYSENESGSGATIAPTATTKYIGIYSGPPIEGGQPENPPEETIWSNYVGKEGNGIDSSNTYIEYNFNNDGINPPDEDDINWGTTVPDVPQGYYLWTRTVFTYTNGEKTYSYSSSYQGEDGQDAEAYDIEVNQNQVFKFASGYDDNNINWTFSPDTLKFQIFKRPREENQQALQVDLDNDIDVKIIGVSESLREYIGKEVTENDNEETATMIVFNISQAYDGNSNVRDWLNKQSGQIKLIYKKENKEVANKVINYTNGTDDDMAKFALNAADINMAIGSTKVVFNIDGLRIHNGGLKIFKDDTTDDSSKVFYADEQGNLHIAGTLEGANGTFSGTLSGANGSFNGKVEAREGAIGGFIINEGAISSTDGGLVLYNNLNEQGSSIKVNSIQLGNNAKVEDYIQLGTSAYIRNPDKHNKLFIEAENLKIYENGETSFGQIEIYPSSGDDLGCIKHINDKWKIGGDGTAIFKDVIADNVLLQDTVLQIGTVQSVGSLMIFKDSWKVISLETVVENDKSYSIIELDGVATLQENDWLYSGENVYKVVEDSIHNAETNSTRVVLDREFVSTDSIITKFGKATIDNQDKPGFVISIFGQGNGYEEYGNRKFASPNALTISSFKENVSEEGPELKYTKHLVLGQLDELSGSDEILYGGDINGLGLYADNVFLNGSLTTQIGSGSYAGINTLSGSRTNKFDDKDNSKIVFWAGATDKDVANAPFQVTEQGSIYASRGKFTGAVISESEIQGADIYAARIHGGAIGQSEALTVYDTDNTHGGISFRTGYNSEAEQQPSGAETLRISSDGFRRNKGSGRFIELNEDNIVFTGNKIILTQNSKNLNIEGNVIYSDEIEFKNEDRTKNFITINAGNTIISSTTTQITENLILKGIDGEEMTYQPGKNGEGYDLYIN